MLSRNIKISKQLYEILKGVDWPSYGDYLLCNISQNVYDEIVSYEKQFKYPINNIDLLTDYVSTTQAGQELFVIAMLQGKLKGTFLEIGAEHPILRNNTYLLETQFQFSGISIDIDTQFYNSWQQERPNNNLIICDALKYDYSTLPSYVDYVQIDIEPPLNNLLVLKKILSNVEFSVMTFEHDIYTNTDEAKLVKHQSKKLLEMHGYELIVNNITANPKIDSVMSHGHLHFEDWYVNPKTISRNVIDAYKCIDLSNKPKYASNIIFK